MSFKTTGVTWLIFCLASIGVLVLGLFYLCGQKKNSSSASTPLELVVYCAAGIKPAVADIAKDFEQNFNVRVSLEYGGSGTLLSRITIASYGDLYIAADDSYIKLADQKGLLLQQFSLATQSPVLAVQKGNPKQIRSLSDLTRPEIKISLGNPEAASIGKLGKFVLEKAGVWKAIESNVREHGVFKPTVPELLIDMELGVSDAAILWDAMLYRNPKFEAIHTTELDQSKVYITAGVLKSSSNATLALCFVHYLQSTVGRLHFTEQGYNPVDNAIEKTHLNIPQKTSSIR